jgi:RNA polymerase sigma-70 factor (ECF subfamily)
MLTAPRPPLRAVKTETPLSERDDDALMLLAGRGLNAAFTVLVERHQGALRAFCVRSVADARAGDDLAQEVFVALWRQRANYQARGHFKAYLFTIALGRCKNERRTRQRRAEQPEQLEQLETQASPNAEQLDRLVAAERQRKLYDLVAKLPEAQRQAILLRYSAELEYAEIAALTAKPEATIRSRVFFGLSRLKKLIGKGMP